MQYRKKGRNDRREILSVQEIMEDMERSKTNIESGEKEDKENRTAKCRSEIRKMQVDGSK